MKQRIITAADGYRELDEWLRNIANGKILLVCDESIRFFSRLNRHLAEIAESGIDFVYFSDFKPNPLYESVVRGVDLFIREKCSGIMAVGGGSAIDVAKCIKLYSNMDASKNYLDQEIVPNDIPFLVMPTTAGTGSEATRYAVIYYDGKKQSVTHESCIPQTVLMDSSVLKTLPLYQKKSTMLDALCHAIEAYWSVNSTEESRRYSAQAIGQITANMEGYLTNEDSSNEAMLMAANTAGKAINIAQTTAGHAMCYKITGLFGVSHGHAAALCDRILFPWTIGNIDKCIDPRGGDYLRGVLREIGIAMGGDSGESGARIFADIFDGLGLDIPMATQEQFELLKSSVNPVRLKNYPIRIDDDEIDMLYHKILR